jgi:hypothetical protein
MKRLTFGKKPTQSDYRLSFQSQHPDMKLEEIRYRKPNKHPEHTIQRDIIIYLSRHHPDIYVCASLAGHFKGSMLAMKRAKDAGYRPGHLDIVLHWSPNKTIYIEVKSEVGVLTDNQKEVIGILSGMGIPCYVARSVEDVKEILRMEK